MPALPTLLVPGSLRLNNKVHEAKVKSRAPIEYITSWLRERMPEYGSKPATMENRVMIVLAETGSGKSTVLPVAIFRILRDEQTPTGQMYRGASVICTQPRVLTAVALAQSESSRPWNPDIVLGETIGFQTGPVSNRPLTGLIYATTGTLAAQLRNQSDEDIMGLYRFIVVDEAHERSLESDMTLMLLRNFYQRNIGNRNLPFLLLVSATFDPPRYAEYFNVGLDNIAEVRGRAYEIKKYWPERGTNDYPKDAAAMVRKIHEASPDDPPERADILVFIPGAGEARLILEELLEILEEYANPAAAVTHDPFLILVINREVVISQSGDYPLVFAPISELPLVDGRPPSRRVVIANVVAETGLTIDTLKCVIDCGWSRIREIYYPWGIEGVITRPAPQSRIKQRMGRAGRLFDGEFYPLYTKNVYDALDHQQLPDIITIGPADIYLTVVREQQRQNLRMGKTPEFRVEEMSLLDPPAPQAFLAVNSVATTIGFISARAPLPKVWPPVMLTDAVLNAASDMPLAVSKGYGLTSIGYIASTFSRVSMEGIRVLLSGYMWDVAATDLIGAVAMFGVPLASLLSTQGRKAAGSLPPGSDAMRASVPSFLVSRVGGAIIPPTADEMFYFRTRLLVADEFIEAVLILDTFADRLARSNGDVSVVHAWCETAGLDFETLIGIMATREMIIEEMIVAGLDPFRLSGMRIKTIGRAKFTSQVCAIKKCLYDGLRNRVLKFDDNKQSYMTNHGVCVKVPPILSNSLVDRLRTLSDTPASIVASRRRPRWILTDTIKLAVKQPRRGEVVQIMYGAEANLVSVLDGYVQVDTKFINPRSFLSNE